MEPLTLLLFLFGFGLLFGGGELLVRGSARLAIGFGISPLITGLTVVAFSTSAPELAVSLQAAVNGQADIVIGNVIGSNISNVLLILGVSALIAPLVVQSQLIRLDVPVMIATALLLWVLVLDGNVGLVDGLLFISIIIVYLAYAVRASQKESKAVRDEYAQEYGSDRAQQAKRWPLNLGLVALGIVLLIIGAQWLVNGAVAIAKLFGLSELIIGLTIVAVGTSLPELATSAIATLRGERDIAVGNVVGSNIFNVLMVLGLTSIFSPSGVAVSASTLNFDLPVMVAVSIACLPVFFIGGKISRWEGAVFVAYYLAFIIYLLLNASQHILLPAFNLAMLWFVIPITVLTMGMLTYREIRRRQVLK